MNRPLLTLALIVLGTPIPGIACEQFAIPPTASMPDSLAITGVVRAHVAREIPTAALIGPAPGVRLEVIDATGTLALERHLEVYPLAAGLGCEPTARDSSELKEQYPTGSRVVLVARRAEALDGIVVLHSVQFGYLARVPDSAPRLENGCLDFAAFQDSYERNTHPFSFAIAWHNAHRHWFEDHELLRCYDAIEGTTDKTSLQTVLTNLAYYWRWHDAGNDDFADRLYIGLLKSHDVPRRDRKRLMRNFRASREDG